MTNPTIQNLQEALNNQIRINAEKDEKILRLSAVVVALSRANPKAAKELAEGFTLLSEASPKVKGFLKAYEDINKL